MGGGFLRRSGRGVFESARPSMGGAESHHVHADDDKQFEEHHAGALWSVLATHTEDLRSRALHAEAVEIVRAPEVGGDRRNDAMASRSGRAREGGGFQRGDQPFGCEQHHSHAAQQKVRSKLGAIEAANGV